MTRPSVLTGQPSPRNHPVIPTTLTAETFDRVWDGVGPSYSGTHGVVSFGGHLDEDRLVRAVRLTLDAEPILGCRWVDHWFRPYWHREDNLDVREYCEVRDSSNCQADMVEFFESPPHVPLRVLLLRGDADVLCLKLDHRAGDGQATKDCLYLLAAMYNRLRDDPSYYPAPNVSGKRGMRQLGDGFSLRDRLRLFRQTANASRQGNPVGEWTFRVPPDEPLEFAHMVERLDAARVRAIVEYAWLQRATLSQVLLAALYLAVCHVQPQSSDRPLPLIVAVDLRRYLPSKRASALCNLVGAAIIAIDSQPGRSLDDVVKQIRDQVHSQRSDHLGLRMSVFWIDALPIIRHVSALLPQRYLRALGAAGRRRATEAPNGEVRGVVLFTDLGALEPDRLAFAGTDITDAIVTGGVMKRSGFLGMAVSGFQSSMTLTLGYGPRAFVAGLFEHMMRILPA